tara:strand:- start:648 stop:866 length:219 start_codon:yes stop_codon:yes gene_type:complete
MKTRSDWTREICQAFRIQGGGEFSVIAVIPKIHALLVKRPGARVLEEIEQEKPQMPFDEWLDKKLSATATKQ